MRSHSKQDLRNVSPERALEILREGNLRFVNNLKSNRNLLQQVNETSEGQYPFALILSCMDSRTSAELIFDQGLGDIFSVRIAGNCVNNDILGSMEFACKVVGSKLILVLGHTRCGAITGACRGVEMGHLTALLDRIRPAVESTPTDGVESEAEFIDRVAVRNVHLALDQIVERSPILREMLEQDEICIAGGIYDISTGVVSFMDEHVLSGSHNDMAEAK
jgi:carbonic anhydrase